MNELISKLLTQEEIRFTPRRADCSKAARMAVIWRTLETLYKLRDLIDRYISDIRAWFIKGKLEDELRRFDAQRRS